MNVNPIDFLATAWFRELFDISLKQDSVCVRERT